MTENYYSTSNDAFNARHLNPSEVADGFIPPPFFNQLFSNSHSMLVGPRGSGKTTLLKMLQFEALSAWEAEKKLSNGKPNFIGIFVPADVRWARQLTAKTNGISDPQARQAIHEAAFGNAVNLAFLETLEQWLSSSVREIADHIAVDSDKVLESRLALSLAELWGVDLAVPSLFGVKHSLRKAQAKIPALAWALKDGGKLGEIAVNNPFVAISWLDALSSAVETVSDIFGVPNEKWALLLDELEIVPHDLLSSILASLRSSKSEILFKVALSPTGSGSELLSDFQVSDPSRDNDFKLIKLWYTDRDSMRRFSERLFASSLRKRGFRDVSEKNLSEHLGLSHAAESSTKTRSFEGNTQRQFETKRENAFKELYEKDQSFKKFLEGKGVDINSLDTSDGDRNGPLIRKITPLVVLRNYVLKSFDEGVSTKRSVKSVQPYLGYPNILDITEGNPRWILNLVDEIVALSKAKGQGLSSDVVQAASIDSFSQRFLSLLKVYPVGGIDGQAQMALSDFLSILAESCTDQLYEGEFLSDPSLSFKIDPESLESYGDFIETCIHLGALVVMNSSSQDGDIIFPNKGSLKGARVRLCYRLAPEFFLPLRSTRSVLIKSAIAKKVSKVPKRALSVKNGKTNKSDSLNARSQFDLF